MKICDYNHDEIVFDGNKCPLCEKMDEISDLNDEIEELKSEIQTLESTVDELGG
jgi:transcription initiation factor IIE alpha subunit